MPSAESQELNDLYRSMAERMHTSPGPDLWVQRGMFEELATIGREPSDVTYSEIDVQGLRGLWCKPIGARSDRVILYIHGGGFIGGSAASHRKLTAHLAKAIGVWALSIDYRLAPEHPFPAQLDDIVTAFQWLRDQGFAAQHIVTAGDSAGGNLAITTVLKLKQLGENLPAAIISLSPWLDMELAGKSVDTNAGTDHLISRGAMTGLRHLLLGVGTSPTDPLANPLRADLAGLPPVYLAVSDSEVLLDDSVRFADLARNQGVSVEMKVESGVQHVYSLAAGRAPEADRLISDIADWARPLLGLDQVVSRSEHSA